MPAHALPSHTSIPEMYDCSYNVRLCRSLSLFNAATYLVLEPGDEEAIANITE